MKKYKTITFRWYENKAFTWFTVHDKTLEDALIEAKNWGYTAPKWYKPWTWNNECNAKGVY